MCGELGLYPFPSPLRKGFPLTSERDQQMRQYNSARQDMLAKACGVVDWLNAEPRALARLHYVLTGQPKLKAV